jgi:hypothetical protein
MDTEVSSMKQQRFARLAIAGLLAFAAAPGASASAAPAPRVVDLRYDLPGTTVEGVGGVCLSLCSGAFAKKGEKTLTVEAIDDHSPFAYVVVYQDFTGDGIPDQRDEMCQARGEKLTVTTKPYARIGAYTEAVAFSPRYPSAEQACPAAPTSGTIRLTFKR